jgi:hypothetical protein
VGYCSGAWSVLQSVLRTNGLAILVPQASKSKSEVAVLSSECKTGTTNILTESCAVCATFSRLPDLLKDADPDIPILKQAKVGYAKLQ